MGAVLRVRLEIWEVEPTRHEGESRREARDAFRVSSRLGMLKDLGRGGFKGAMKCDCGRVGFEMAVQQWRQLGTCTGGLRREAGAQT